MWSFLAKDSNAENLNQFKHFYDHWCGKSTYNVWWLWQLWQRSFTYGCLLVDSSVRVFLSSFDVLKYTFELVGQTPVCKIPHTIVVFQTSIGCCNRDRQLTVYWSIHQWHKSRFIYLLVMHHMVWKQLYSPKLSACGTAVNLRILHFCSTLPRFWRSVDCGSLAKLTVMPVISAVNAEYASLHTIRSWFNIFCLVHSIRRWGTCINVAMNTGSRLGCSLDDILTSKKAVTRKFRERISLCF